MLLKDFFAHRAALGLVQAQHLDGHPILFPDLEAGLKETLRIIESAVAAADEYLSGRAEFRKAESNGEVCEGNPSIVL